MIKYIVTCAIVAPAIFFFGILAPLFSIFL